MQEDQPEIYTEWNYARNILSIHGYAPAPYNRQVQVSVLVLCASETVDEQVEIFIGAKTKHPAQLLTAAIKTAGIVEAVARSLLNDSRLRPPYMRARRLPNGEWQEVK